MKTNTVWVVFKSTPYRKYAFRNDIEGIKEGDLVVVDTVHGFNIALVDEVFDGLHEQAKKWIVSKIDVDAHKKRLERDAKLDELKTKMELRKKQLSEIATYQLLAKEDEVMQELLNEYLKELNG